MKPILIILLLLQSLFLSACSGGISGPSDKLIEEQTKSYIEKKWAGAISPINSIEIIDRKIQGDTAIVLVRVHTIKEDMKNPWDMKMAFMKYESGWRAEGIVNE